MTQRPPLVLQADNFTPPQRTPWGGTRIRSVYKAGLIDSARGADAVVGESWEISVSPEFPSRVLATGQLLKDALAEDPEGYLGAPTARALGSTSLLVKLLDAADDLSVQIHPADDYARLGSGESGKPESWYVLDTDPGAGLYLGWRKGVDRVDVEEAVATGADLSTLLFFVPVEPGDFFAIEAGTAHAIGRGITLLEPQRVLPGRRGVTYRYWDWNRRYDDAGRPSPAGEPRALHLEAALEVTAWDGPREAALLATIRHRAGPPDLSTPARREALSGPRGPVRFDAITVDRIGGSGTLDLAPPVVLSGLTVVAGAISLEGDGFRETLRRGQSAVLPAGTAMTAHLEGAHALLACTDPTQDSGSRARRAGPRDLTGRGGQG